jgi:hypothetical protein
VRVLDLTRRHPVAGDATAARGHLTKPGKAGIPFAWAGREPPVTSTKPHAP